MMNYLLKLLISGLLIAAGSVTLVCAETTTVRIVRDTYGVPHIYADDSYGLFYGYGYAVGQDRLFQMEMIKRTTSGRVAEVIGREYLALDISVRLGFDPESLYRQLQQLKPAQRSVFEGYAAGLNKWIEAVNKAPGALMPKEFIDFGFKPSAWTAYDVVLVFAGSIAHRYADFNEEIDNLAFYQALIEQHGKEKAWHIFNTTLPLYHPASPTTVPERAARHREIRYTGDRPPPYLDDLLTATIQPTARAAYQLDGKYLPIANNSKRQHYIDEHLMTSGIAGRAGYSSASNIWLVNGDRVKDAKGVLVNGPQFGWINPSYVYGVGLHGAGYNVVGNTLLAFPFMLFAHNQHVSWGSTAGFGDLVDIYVNKLNPNNAKEYYYQGAYRPLMTRQDTIKIKGQAPVKETFYRTIHGPVILIDKKKGLAYSKKRSWEGSEVETGLAWVELAKSASYKEWRQYLSRMSLNINFYFLDKLGNIAYTHTGKYPRRGKKHDSRLPVLGDGNMDWPGYLPFIDNPHVYNPQQGFIVNWNNRPERGWRNPDLWWVRWGRAHRVDILHNALKAKPQFTAQELWQINSRASFADVNAHYLLPALHKAMLNAELSSTVTQAYVLLSHWDQYWRDVNRDGYYDSAATLIMQTWLTRLLETVFKDDIGDKYFSRFAAPGYPKESILAAISVSPGIKIIIDSLHNDARAYDFFNGVAANHVLRDTFVAAINDLAKARGEDIEKWQLRPEPLIFRAYNFRGAPQTTKDNAQRLPLIMNRGSENNQFIADGKKIQGRDVFAPGQSGFMAADGTKSPHYDDQMQLYQTFGSKPLPFTETEVEAMKVTETVLLID